MKRELDEIVALAKRQIELEKAVADVEKCLSDIKAELAQVQREDLPSAMMEAQLQNFKLEDGAEVILKNDFDVGIPPERRDEAYNWLESNQFGGLITTEVVVSFRKGELEKAKAVAEAMAKKKLDASVERSIHWQTLKAWVKEQETNRRKYPADLFGAHPLDKTIVKFPKQ